MFHIIDLKNTGPEWQNLFICFQAYSTVVSAAEGNDPGSDNFGKVDDVKQYPSSTNIIHHLITRCEEFDSKKTL